MKNTLVLLMTFLLFLFSSCARTNSYRMEELNQNVILYNTLETVLSYEKMDRLSQRLNASSFCKKVGISKYKIFNNMKYSVIQTTAGYYAVYIGNGNERVVLTKIVFSEKTKEEFLSFTKRNITAEEMLDFDPDATYSFREFGRIDIPKYSVHFLRSGDCYVLDYDESDENQLVKISHFTI